MSVIRSNGPLFLGPFLCLPLLPLSRLDLFVLLFDLARVSLRPTAATAVPTTPPPRSPRRSRRDVASPSRLVRASSRSGCIGTLLADSPRGHHAQRNCRSCRPSTALSVTYKQVMC